jgi:phosphatidylserine/phosphatidylglycerophosphate/cardiolipin synthase-like enzyme
MASFAGGKIEAFLGPPALGAADDLEKVIVDFIGEARSSLRIAVQELDSRPIAQAIIDARWRGVAVELFLEQDYLRSRPRSEPPKPPRRRANESPEEALQRVQWGVDDSLLAENRNILAALLRSFVEVRGDFNPKIFHQKFILRDFHDGRVTKPGTPALLSGSANFTHTDTRVNLNHVFVFHSPHVCRQYDAEFSQLRRGQFGRGAHGDVPRTYDLGGVPAKVLFAPDHTPELELMKQMLKAQATSAGPGEVLFAIFTFAGSSGIDDTMIALARGRTTVRGVLDPGQARQKWAVPATMTPDTGVELFVPVARGAFKGLRKLHHKLMVINERVVVAGSFNYTQPANDYNDENLFVLGSVRPKTEGVVVSAQACQELALHMKAEIERIIAGSERFRPSPG